MDIKRAKRLSSKRQLPVASSWHQGQIRRGSRGLEAVADSRPSSGTRVCDAQAEALAHHQSLIDCGVI
eukprot:6711418-Alexandrium_andersonii.AAC.1